MTYTSWIALDGLYPFETVEGAEAFLVLIQDFLWTPRCTKKYGHLDLLPHIQCINFSLRKIKQPGVKMAFAH